MKPTQGNTDRTIRSPLAAEWNYDKPMNIDAATQPRRPGVTIGEIFETAIVTIVVCFLAFAMFRAAETPSMRYSDQQIPTASLTGEE